jgi:hypothetical protein
MEVRTDVAEEEVWVIAGQVSQKFLPLVFVPVARAHKLPSIRSEPPIKVFAADRKACCLGNVEKTDNVVEEFLWQTK